MCGFDSGAWTGDGHGTTLGADCPVWGLVHGGTGSGRMSEPLDTALLIDPRHVVRAISRTCSPLLPPGTIAYSSAPGPHSAASSPGRPPSCVSVCASPAP